MTGKPYSADQKTETVKGVTSTARIFRDSQGRVRREVTVPGVAGAKPRTNITISDYAAKVRYNLNPETKTAVRTVIEEDLSGGDGRREGEGHAPGHVEPPHGERAERREGGEHHEGGQNGDPQRPARKHEDLGIRTMQGVSAHGSRNTLEMPSGPVVDESWFATDLGVEIKAIHTDARTGQTVRTLSNLKRAEPDRALFTVPADYKLN